MAATLYRALTGRTPPEAPDRLAHDDLIPPSKMGAVLPRRAEQALLKALAVRQAERFQSVADFQKEVNRLEPPPAPSPPPPPFPWKWAAFAAAVIVILALAVFWFIAGGSKTGKLTITANVVGAKISMDGRTQPDWLTPHRFDKLPAGPHLITATKDGYQTASQKVNLPAGVDESLQVNLPPVPRPPPPPPQFGRLDVRANVVGATILVDGTTQSDWLTPHRFDKLSAGPHVVTAMKNGYLTASQRVDVTAGANELLQVNLPRVAPPPPPPRPQLGRLDIRANLVGATILVDGRSQADWVTPHSFSGLSARTYSITVRKAGYRSVRQNVTVEAGGTNSIVVYLKRGPPQAIKKVVKSLTLPPNLGAGELVVISNVTGARITIDGADTGFSTPHTFSGLSAGPHTVSLLKDSYDPGGGRFTVEAGKSVTANVSLSLPMQQLTLAVLEVSSSHPEGVPILAEVFIDGKSYGRSPVKTKLPPGVHHYQVITGSNSERGSFKIRSEVGALELAVKILKN